MIRISRSCVPILLRFVFAQFGNLEPVVGTCVGAAAAAAHPLGASSWWTSRTQDACGVEHFHATMPRKDLSNRENPRAGPSSSGGRTRKNRHIRHVCEFSTADILCHLISFCVGVAGCFAV